MEAMSSLAEMSPMASMSGMSSMGNKLWQELLPGKNGAPINDLLYEQYDLVYGSWPNSYDEIVLVLDENNEIDDLALYALGLISEEEINALADAAKEQVPLEDKETHKWSYEEICNTQYKTILNSDCYRYDETTNTYVDLRENEYELQNLYNNAFSLRVTGIIKPNPDADAHMLSGSIAYINKLTEYVVNQSKDAAIIQQQLSSPDIDILTGIPFKTTTGTLTAEEKQTAIKEYISKLDVNGKAMIMSAINKLNTINEKIAVKLSEVTEEEIVATLIGIYVEKANISESEAAEIINGYKPEERSQMYYAVLYELYSKEYDANTSVQQFNPQNLANELDTLLPNLTVEQCVAYYDGGIMAFSESTYEENLAKIGYVDLDSPASINIYASSFENKDIITASIEEYNNNVDELKRIKYTDYLGIMMSSITTIINAITYVLIAFVAISLVVSSIMIGVITLISVQERTKEIGILRAIGASKRDVSGLFNAETVIVGFASGLLGILITYLLCIPINLILNALTGIANLKAILPLGAAIVLVLISVCLTLISGIIPSRSAAKKDPVTALRSE